MPIANSLQNRCYDKAQSTKDKGGRKIWHFQGIANRELAEEDKAYLTAGAMSASPQIQPTPSIFGFGAPSAPAPRFVSQPAVPSASPVHPTLPSKASPAGAVLSPLARELVLLSLLCKGAKIGEN